MRETPDPTATPPASDHSSALARRLLQRASAPLGGIDTRPARARVERAQEWSRRHVALVERHLGRAQAAVEGDSTALVLAERTVVEAQPVAGTGPPAAMAPNPAVAEAPDSLSHVQPPLRGDPSFERSAAVADGGRSPAVGAAADPSVSAEPGAPPVAARGASNAAETASPATAASRVAAPGSTLTVQRKAVAATADGVPVSGRSPVSMPLLQPAPPSRSRARSEDSPAPAASTRRTGEAASVTSRVAEMPPQPPLLSPSGHTVAVSSLELARRAERLPAFAESSDQRPGPPESSRAQERPTPSPSLPAESVASAAVAPAGGARADSLPAPLPLRAVAGARDAVWPEMVWRGGGESATPIPGAGVRPGREAPRFSGPRAVGAAAEAAPAAVANAREAGAPAPVAQAAAPVTARGTTYVSGTGVAPAAPNDPAPAAAGSVDVGRLAEQVTRIILRQAVVERERRGDR